MMARNIQIILLQAPGIFWTNAQKNTNPRVGIRLLVGPPGLEPGTKGLCLLLQFSLPVSSL